MRAPGGSTRTMAWQVVLLPLPDSPTRPNVSPASRLEAHPVYRLYHTSTTEARVVDFQILHLQQWRHYRLLTIAQLRVQAHPQPVAQHVSRQYQERDTDTRKTASHHLPSMRDSRS